MDIVLDTAELERCFGRGALERLISREGFDRAVKSIGRASLRTYKGNWLLCRLLNDRGRYSASFLVLDLHFNANDGRGMTAADLRSEAVACNICSAGRATAFLAALRFGKFVRAVPASNRRERRYGPTEIFLNAHRARWTNVFKAIHEYDPDLATRGLGAPDVSKFGPALNSIVNHLRGGVRPFLAMPMIRYYADREGGFATLTSLDVLDDGAALTAREVGKRFCISRTHAASLLRKAVRDGLAREVPDGFIAGPLLMPALRNLYGMIFLIFEEALIAGEATLRQDQRVTA